MLCYSYLKNEETLGIVWLTKVRELYIKKEFQKENYQLICLYDTGDKELLFSNSNREKVEEELDLILGKLCINLTDTKTLMQRLKVEKEVAIKKAKEEEIARAKADKEAELERLQRELQELK